MLSALRTGVVGATGFEPVTASVSGKTGLEGVTGTEHFSR
jgi:hypothetical protein